MKDIAFSGHRVLPKTFSKEKLRACIEKRIQEGAENFYSGMALGFDMLAAECVIELKNFYPFIRLIACLPCKNQAVKYPREEQRRYDELIKKADEIICLEEGYTDGCMLRRNDYLASHTDGVIAYCTSFKGGTVYTINRFKKEGKQVFCMEE